MTDTSSTQGDTASKPTPINLDRARDSVATQENLKSPTGWSPPLTRTTSTLSTSFTPTEKGFDHLRQVKDEERIKSEWDIHCTCYEGAHHPLRRKESRDPSSSGCTPHSPLSPRSESVSPAQTGYDTPQREEKKKGECKDCAGCEKDKKKDW